MRRLAVLASGAGTNLQAIIEAGLEVTVVAVDRRCGAIEIAEQARIPVELVERTDFSKEFDRDAYTHAVVDALKPYEIDVIAMAGFGTILSQPIHDAYPNRMLNTHPALLPAFKGWHAVDDALAYGVKVTGWTVHVVTLDVDAGPIIAQEAVRVEPGDTKESLHERIKEIERVKYPEVIREFMKGLG